jgi:hypothetical protein
MVVYVTCNMIRGNGELLVRRVGSMYMVDVIKTCLELEPPYSNVIV